MAKRKSGKSGSKGSKKLSNEVLIVASKMKDAIRNSDCNVSSDVLEALNFKVHTLLGAAVQRAKDNGRKTVRGYDL